MGLVLDRARPMAVHRGKERDAVEGTQYLTKEAVLKRAQEAVGIPLRQIDTTGRLATGKGAIGTVLEESWFCYQPNGEAQADFPEAGVELKVTPYVKSSAGIRAKALSELLSKKVGSVILPTPNLNPISQKLV